MTKIKPVDIDKAEDMADKIMQLMGKTKTDEGLAILHAIFYKAAVFSDKKSKFHTQIINNNGTYVDIITTLEIKNTKLN